MESRPKRILWNLPIPKLAHSFSFGDLPIPEKEENEDSEEMSVYSDESNDEKENWDDKSKTKGHWTAEEDSLL